MKLDLTDLLQIAQLTWDIGRLETTTTRIAICWAVKNCLCDGEFDTPADETTVLSVCRSFRADAGHMRKHCPENTDDLIGDHACYRSLAALCGVICEDLADPSHGALRLHRHSSAPAWARTLKPTALIGRYFFYNDPSLHGHWNRTIP